MKMIFFLLVFTTVNYCSFSQVNSIKCPVSTDTVEYFKIAFYYRGSHPHYMDGVAKKMDKKKLVHKNVDQFLISFYKQAFYTVNFPNGIQKGFEYCLGADSTVQRTVDSLMFIQSGVSHINQAFKMDTVKLKGGAVAIIRSAKVIGTFLKIPKGIGVYEYTSSIEFSLNEIPTVKTIYVPTKLRLAE